MTDDLAVFIAARLDEDEAVVKAAADSSKRAKCTEWTASRDGNGYVVGDKSGHFAFCFIGGKAVMEHIIRHDPARALREVEAKRAILAEHGPGAVVDDSDGRWRDDPENWDAP